MSIGREEFFRMLPGAVELPIIHRGDIARGRGWTVQAGILPALNIASLSLPRLRVQIDFTSCEAEHMCAFMARFDRCFQRGGG